MQINQKFKNLIPPLSVEERELLKESIKSEGVRDKLIVWNGMLIDGHNRYEICQELKIPFETQEKDFDSESEAEEWIMRNQLARRNLPDVERARIALKLKDRVAVKAKERQVAQLKQNSTVVPNLAQRQETNILPNLAECTESKTMIVLAKQAGIGKETLRKVEKVDKTAPEPIKQAMGKVISIDQAYRMNREIQREPVDQREELAKNRISEEYMKSLRDLERRQRISSKLEKMIYNIVTDTALICEESIDCLLSEGGKTVGEWMTDIDRAIEFLGKMKELLQKHNVIRRVK